MPFNCLRRCLEQTIDESEKVITNGKSLESWVWGAACSIRGAQEAPKFKDFILPLIFTKRLCDVFDDELNRIAKEVGSRAKSFKLVERDHKLVRFYLPLKPDNPDDAVWSVIRKLTGKIGESLTTYLHAIAKLAKGQARKLFNHPLVIQLVETCPRQRRAAGFLDR